MDCAGEEEGDTSGCCVCAMAAAAAASNGVASGSTSPYGQLCVESGVFMSTGQGKDAMSLVS